MAATLSDFIRWARDKVIENPAVANYHPRCAECGVKFSEFFLANGVEEIRLEPDFGDDEDEEPDNGGWEPEEPEREA